MTIPYAPRPPSLGKCALFQETSKEKLEPYIYTGNKHGWIRLSELLKAWEKQNDV